ncbi:MAG TPA: hypothetical protein VFP56_02080 [Candidatus Limnocylindrales bacterium]|nr:hypothetical protein [Candidatus Limnocylindrales bacterium]
MHLQNSEFHPMHVFAPYLLAIHQQDLIAAAEVDRRAKLAHGGQLGVAAWRRGLGGFLAFAARSLDPSIEARRTARGRGARALAG